MSPVTETAQVHTTVVFEKYVLYPITAEKNDRYNAEATISSCQVRVHSGSYYQASSMTLPEGWTAHLHPEGAIYYVNTKLRLVTNTPVHDAAKFEKLCGAIAAIQNIISGFQWTLPQDYEIQLQLDTDSSRCGYYAVDHDRQIEFWFEDVDSCEHLEIDRVSSRENLNYKMQQHYWYHVEYYPHRPVPKPLRQELLGCLRHARADILTSSVSTFPYDADLCKQLIKAIDLPDEACDNTYITCTIARIWQTVALHRFQNYYGETYARLCLDEQRLGLRSDKMGNFLKLGYVMLFNMPESIHNDLKLLFNDNMLYAKHWVTFADKTREMWKTTCLQSVCLVTANGILLVNGRTFLSVYPGLTSLGFATAGLYSSFNLLEHYNEADKYSADIAAQHLHQIWAGVGFARLAAVFALPKALVGWSIILLTTEVLGLAFEKTNFCLIYILGAMAALGMIIYLLQMLISWVINIISCRKKTVQEDGLIV